MDEDTDDGKFFKVLLWNMNCGTPPQVTVLLKSLGNSEMSLAELMDKIGLTDRKNFRDLYLKPALDFGLIEMTIPDKPTSKTNAIEQ